ncbi:hypothetical protein RUM44_002167 [Polyplax serrata]|uniref:AAA+ ATPase domain-containing protein n=1 Tax=Polyplax serrata TaxID=468196 RepID=A0ABR1AM75_POLSC
MANDTLTLHFEVRQRAKSHISRAEIQRELDKYLGEQEEVVLDALLYDVVLPNDVEYVRICANSDDKYKVNILKEKFNKQYHIYQVWEESPQVDSLDEESEEVPASVNWCLPNVAFEGLWESLILENGLKEQLMSYVETTLLYSCKKVNAQVIHWNGVVLLHGPPGTGKTSLCKALSQKLSIRLNSQYKTSQLIEINTHSLFSKWFSESAKLVAKMFTSVKQWLQSKDHFVCLLIDEVESLTHIRQATGVEPSDSIRVVNAVLTQIDQLQMYSNVLILATSNVTGTIDVAFADRADLKLFISYPSEWGVYEILRSCIEELIRCNLVEGDKNDFVELLTYKKLSCTDKNCDEEVLSEAMKRSEKLMKVAHLCKGLSGRTLRKVPFLTSTKFTNKATPSVAMFLEAMIAVVEQHKKEQNHFFGQKSS